MSPRIDRSVAVLLGGLALVACSVFTRPAPETAARDAYRVAKIACEVYELTPASRHSDEVDRTCRSLRLVCE